MAERIPVPKPLFDTLENIAEKPECVSSYLRSINIKETDEEFELALEFLESYSGSPDTFNSYRREVERLLQWSWLIAKKPIIALNRNDIRKYIDFAVNPPSNWIATKTVSRFVTQQKDLTRNCNPDWRPFVVRISKSQHRAGQDPNAKQYSLSNKSMQALFAGLSTFFTYLQQEEYLDSNPVALIRQKSRYLQKTQSQKVTRKLSHLQWEYVINTAEKLAQSDPLHERTLFLMSGFYLLGLRISEFAETPGRIPKMGDFAPDKKSLWWFTTVGKGNKLRDVAVPDAMLETLKRYRVSNDLNPLPARDESTPLLQKQRGKGGLGTRQIRNLVQECFDQAILRLEKDGKTDEAQDLNTATVHWLRHTAISADIEHRPREHVRDDVGHEDPATTERYIDTDRHARHASAKDKLLKPENSALDEETLTEELEYNPES